MAKDEVAHGGADGFPPRVEEQGAFAYTKRVVTPKVPGRLQVSFMEISPGKSAYPMHWHERVTEAYVILTGRGSVRTEEHEFLVGPGEVVVFPAGPAGAHRLTNVGTEPLRYVDIDTVSEVDVCHYPDSEKTAVITTRTTTMWRDDDTVEYYDGEPDAT